MATRIANTAFSQPISSFSLSTFDIDRQSVHRMVAKLSGTYCPG